MFVLVYWYVIAAVAWARRTGCWRAYGSSALVMGMLGCGVELTAAGPVYD